MSMAVPDGHRALGEGTVADHLAGLDRGSRAESVTSEPAVRYTWLMVALDTLAYVRHLESAGVPRAQAEAQAEAVASFAGDTLATKRDLLEVEARLRAEIRELDIHLSGRMDLQDAGLNARMDQIEARMEQAEARFNARMEQAEGRFNARMEQLEGRMTIKLVGMLVAAVGLVAVLVKPF